MLTLSVYLVAQPGTWGHRTWVRESLQLKTLGIAVPPPHARTCRQARGDGDGSVPRTRHGEEGAKRQHVPCPLEGTGSPAVPQHHGVLRAGARAGAAGKGGSSPGRGAGISGAVRGFVCRIKGRREPEPPPSSLGMQHKLGTNPSGLGCLTCGCARHGRGKDMGHRASGTAVPYCAVPGPAGPRRRRPCWGLSSFVIRSSFIPRRDFCLPLSRAVAEII